MTKNAILALDQGTTSSRAIVFDADMKIAARAQQEFAQIYPHDGWVEHDPEAIWETSLTTAKAALSGAKDKGLSVKAIGITNQRETTIVWDRNTGAPIYNAIVWQDRRTADMCDALKSSGDNVEAKVSAKTGLLLDPYFSATKISWILDNVDGARARAEAGELAFGTVDSFLIWRLTGGKSHVTDATNASRTNLFNIMTGEWDEALCKLFNVPLAMLPAVLDCADDFGISDEAVLGKAIPILGAAGDQQAALIGQACFAPGDIKSTYGTGCFVVLNTGETRLTSQNRLLSTVAYRLGGQITYALEGSIFVAGAAMQWLRDGISIIDDAAKSEAMAAGQDSNNGVYLVPAFTGLGAPHWRPDARGGIFGITRDTSREDIVRAALESVCYQTRDLLDAMADDGESPVTLKVDGGMVGNDWLCQFLADTLSIDVERSEIMETTVLGAAYLAGMQAGIYPKPEAFAKTWKRDAGFTPSMDAKVRDKNLAGWDSAIARVLG